MLSPSHHAPLPSGVAVKTEISPLIFKCKTDFFISGIAPKFLYG